jgi:hypothetical protein
MSASASRPRITVHDVLAWTRPASPPAVAPNLRAARVATPSARAVAASADGARAADSLTPPAILPASATSHQTIGGFSSQGRPPIVGTRTFPPAIISRAPCATNAS